MNHIVYQTTCLVNSKIYIGVHETEDIDDSYLGSGVALQNAIRKYGRENFKRIILKNCLTRQEADLEEEKLVTWEFISRKDTYNLKTGGGRKGSLSVESRKKSSLSNKIAHTGKILSEEHRKRISLGNLALRRTVTDEAKRRISLANTGKLHSAETKERIAEAGRGRTVSLETRAKHSLAKKGKPSPLIGSKRSEDFRKKISAALFRRPPMSEETKAKMRKTIATTRKPPTEETKAKIRKTIADKRLRSSEVIEVDF